MPHVAAALAVTSGDAAIQRFIDDFRRILLASIILSSINFVLVLSGSLEHKRDFQCWGLIAHLGALLAMVFFIMGQAHYGYFIYIFVYLISIPSVIIMLIHMVVELPPFFIFCYQKYREKAKQKLN